MAPGADLRFWVHLCDRTLNLDAKTLFFLRFLEDFGGAVAPRPKRVRLRVLFFRVQSSQLHGLNTYAGGREDTLAVPSLPVLDLQGSLA